MIAIHCDPQSHSTKLNHPNYEVRWIDYCEKNNISYKIVNAYDTNIIEHLKDCTAFMWNHNHNKYQDLLFAKQLLFSLQEKGIKTFPDFKTGWHFDDKLGQKYLFEAMNIDAVPTYVFYSKDDALAWVKATFFPKVFKLRGGAGSANVKLVKNAKQAKRLINRAFGKGFPSFDQYQFFKEKLRLFKLGKDKLGLLKGLYGLVFYKKMRNLIPSQSGYVYFQDYIPNNNYDVRIVIVAGKAYAIKRIVRSNDFRASGSGNIDYNHNLIDLELVKIAQKINIKLNAQALSYDFIYDENSRPLIVEISYTNKASGYDKCEGYWDDKLNFHKGEFNPYGWMVEMVR